MRHGILLAVVLAIVLATAGSAEAQLGRRLRLRDPNQQSSAPAPAPAPRPEGQLRQRMQNLGGRVQTVLESGALDGAIDGLSNPTGTPLPGALPGGAALVPHALEPQFPPGQRPFTTAWYAAHPRAWRLPEASVDVWTGASIGTLTTWLGIPTPAPALSPTGENVFTDQSVAPAAAISVAGDYLPLGVFALGPAGAQRGSALLQLAVNKGGEVRGTYYDVVTGESQTLTGNINKETQLATLRLESSQAAEFEVSLISLTRPEGNVRLRFAAGATQDWSLARFEPEGTDS